MTAKRVLICDDSALIRQLLSEILGADPGLEVVGVAADANIARQMIKSLQPDVMTLDVEMPGMDGITFLRNIMRLRPMPVVMVSTLTERGAEITLEALSIGAVDCVAKPKTDVTNSLHNYASEICEIVNVAAGAKVSAKSAALAARAASHVTEFHTISSGQIKQIIAIGASTGGTEAINEVLRAMPSNSPPVLITQHIPEGFSKTFAKRLDLASKLTVCEAEHQQPLKIGHAYVAPGDQHLRLEKTTGGYVISLDDGPKVNRHRPSVGVMFDSIVEQFNGTFVAALLTGMGNDGAQELLKVRESGGLTIAQNEATSVVWGMPGRAVELGAVKQVLPISKIALALMRGFDPSCKMGT